MIVDEILGLLEAEGIGVSSGASAGYRLWWNFMPDTPDRGAALYERPGEPDEETKTGLVKQLPRLQVITRSPDFAEAMTKAWQIRAVFESVDHQTLGTSLYFKIDPLQPPFTDPGGGDARGRARIVANYRLERKPL